MAITTTAITFADRDRLVGRSEDHFYERKARAAKPASLSKTISAFANTDGGELLIGIDDDGVWDGFEKPEDANGVLAILEDILPHDPGHNASFLTHPDQSGFVLLVDILKSRSIVRATDGIPRIRRGAQNLRVDSEEGLEQLKRNKGITSFETSTIDAEPDLISNSEATLTFVLTVVPHAEPESWLRKQRLLIGDKPTVAGVLLFADLPQALIPRSGIKLYRYGTIDIQGSRETMVGEPCAIEGTLYQVIEEAVLSTGEMVSGVQRLGPEGLEEISYPTETLHEIITNAVIHRDYALQDEVHVRIFDNRIEVESPGTLPGHVTVDNILEERYSRNSAIVRLINKHPDPPNKDVGEGLRTAFAAMRKLKLKDPEIIQRTNSVLVIIRHERLASPEEIVLEFLNSHPTITNSRGRALTGIQSENAMKEVFYRLRDRGLLERVPELRGRKSAWRPPEISEPESSPAVQDELFPVTKE